MNAPNKVHLRPVLTAMPRDPALPPGQPRYRVRWHAELTRPGRPAVRTGGHEQPDEAFAAVVELAADECDTARDVLALVGSLFGDPAHRPPLIQLARAVRFASRLPRRAHPGCEVTIGDPADALPAPAGPKRLAKRGLAGVKAKLSEYVATHKAAKGGVA